MRYRFWVPLAARHTGTTLYTDKTVTVKGIVKSWLWSNPHCLLKIDVTGEDGSILKAIARNPSSPGTK